MAIEAQELEIQIGARTLLHPTNFHVAKGDKIGLVGRNGAGKTTLTRVITGDMLPTAGKVRVSGKLGYLPQDTHAADPEQTALDRMMSARDIASIISRIRKAEKEMTDPDPDVMTRAMNRYDKAMQDFEKAGGYAAQSEATAMAASLGLPQEVMGQQLGTLSGGRTDQPFGRRLHRMVTRIPEEIRGWIPGHLPLHRTVGRSGEQGMASGCAARTDRHVFPRLESLPASARG